MIDDPVFYFAAVPAVLLYGIAKGGFAGGFGIVAVPLMALAVPVPQAAAIMLPILLVMDLAAVWAYRRSFDRGLIRLLLPASLVGMGIGTAAFRYLTPDAIRLALGVIAVAFVLYRWAMHAPDAPPAPRSAGKGWLWATVSGVTGFIAHAGSPPLQVYLLPLRLPPAILVGTVAVLFAGLNYAKIVPYWWLGLLSLQNVATAAALVPVGVAGVYIGLWLQRRVNAKLFYTLIYAFLLLTGLKLFYDGLRAIY
ncbi:MAG: sulfite exporter TauE/SafE family protein [Burkholderiales bacterium]